jgi:copper(I)-binding protein
MDMTDTTRRAAIGAAIALLALPAAAHDYTAGDLTILHPWTRAAGANGNGAGFLRLRNGGTQPDRLISASTPAARVVELHTMERDGDVMRMRPVRDIVVAPGATVELRPGSFHIMMIGLTAPMAQGGRVPLTLRFERAGEVQVELAVEAAGARGAGQHH